MLCECHNCEDACDLEDHCLECGVAYCEECKNDHCNECYIKGDHCPSCCIDRRAAEREYEQRDLSRDL